MRRRRRRKKHLFTSKSRASLNLNPKSTNFTPKKMSNNPSNKRIRLFMISFQNYRNPLRSKRTRYPKLSRD